MQQTKSLASIKIVGIQTRTNNASEMNPETAKIPALVQQYWALGLAEKMMHRKIAGSTYCCYTDYKSDASGDYTFLIGEEVSSFDNLPEGCSTLSIPAQHYAVFSNGPGPMPDICIQLWQKIWAMSPEALGGTRAYQTDFELYDRAGSQDPKNRVLDIYIGIKTSA
jgi:predicted transcriptional regulator YdeE